MGIGTAQVHKRPENHPQLLVDYVPPTPSERKASPTLSAERKLFPVHQAKTARIIPPTQSTAADRREKFEADFGIAKKDPSAWKSTLETAKYKVDETVFAAKEFADGLHYDAYLTDVLTGTRSTSAPPRYPSDPIRDSLDHARLRTGLDWDSASGKAFVGLRLVVPIGQ